MKKIAVITLCLLLLTPLAYGQVKTTDPLSEKEASIKLVSVVSRKFTPLMAHRYFVIIPLVSIPVALICIVSLVEIVVSSIAITIGANNLTVIVTESTEETNPLSSDTFTLTTRVPLSGKEVVIKLESVVSIKF